MPGGAAGNNAKRPTSYCVSAQIMCMVGHYEVEKTLEVLSNPLLSQVSFVAEELFQSLANLRFNSGTHQWDVDGDIGGVVQLGSFAFTSQVDVALEINWGALHVSIEGGGELFAVQLADAQNALDLEGLGNHGTNCFWQKGGWKNLEEGCFFTGELVDLAWFWGEVGYDVLPEFLGGVRLVHLFNGVIDSYGVFATG